MQENCMQQRCTLCLHGLIARCNTDTANIDQEVDVVLFTNAAEMKLFLGKHTELSKCVFLLHAFVVTNLF
jgi:hypothetical protein